MIKINLIINQVPTKIDIPRAVKRKKALIIYSIVFFIVLIVLAPSIYLYKLISKPPIKIVKTNINSIEKKKEEKQTNISPQKEVTKEETKTKKTQKQLQKPKKQVAENRTAEKKLVETKQKQLENYKKEAQEGPVFSIALDFTSIPKNIYDNKTPNKPELLPLPKTLAHIEKPKTRKKQSKPSSFYLVTIKTSRVNRLKSILKSHKIKFNIKTTTMKLGYVYDVYVGGFSSLSNIIEFTKALKSKGYHVYSIKNINLLYFACIDKSVDEEKKNAYQKAWSKTHFKIVFTKKPRYKKVSTVTFTTTNKNIIYYLKKHGFRPIIKLVKNGA